MWRIFLPYWFFIVGPSFRDPSTEWQALQAILLNISRPFDSGESSANESDLCELLHPPIKSSKEKKMIRNLICKELVNRGWNIIP